MTSPRPETIENRWDILYRDYPDAYDEFMRAGRGDHAVYRYIFGTFPLTGKTVADVGAGTGRSTFALARRADRVIGVEPEDAMRRLAFDEAARLELRNVEFVAGTAAALPLPDHAVDIVTAFTLAIHPAEGFRDFAREALRIVRPGGYVVNVSVAPFWYGGDLAEVILGPSRVTETDTEGTIERILGGELGFEHADVDSLQEFGSVDEIVRTYGFIFGRKAIDFLRTHSKTSIRWRNRIHFKRAA